MFSVNECYSSAVYDVGAILIQDVWADTLQKLKPLWC